MDFLTHKRNKYTEKEIQNIGCCKIKSVQLYPLLGVNETNMLIMVRFWFSQIL